MATNFITPNLGLVVPLPSLEPGPQYAVDISNALVTIDGKCYSLNNPVVPAGLNLNSDVSLKGNNITNVRSSRMINNLSALVGTSDLNCFYVLNGNAYYNNSSGVPIALTSGSGPAPTSFTAYDIQVVNSAVWTILPSDVYTLLEVAYTATGAVSVVLPLSSSLPSGRFYIVKDAAGQATTHNITINVAGSSSDTVEQATSYVINTNFGSALLWTDASGNWYLLGGDVNISGSHNLHLSTGATLTSDVGSTVNINGNFNTSLMTASTSFLEIVSTLGEIEVLASGALSLEGATGVGILANTGNIQIEATSSAIQLIATGNSVVVTPKLEMPSGTVLQMDSGSTLSMVTGSTMSGTILGNQTWSGSPTFNGSMTSNAGLVCNDGITVNGQLGCTAGSVFGYTVSAPTLPTSGSYVLASNEYNCPVIFAGGVTLSGDLTIVFPNTNGYWTLVTDQLTLAGHSLILEQASTATSSTFSSTIPAMIIVISTTGTDWFTGRVALP